MTKVAFVSFRLKAQDGVSVEAEKWIRVFKEWGCEVSRVAGYIPDPGDRDYVISELNHQDPLIESFTSKVFSSGFDRHEIQSDLALLSETVEGTLLPVLGEIAPDLIVAENIFSLPLNIPLTMVMCRFLAEENISSIAVHHDFFWEHPRFLDCAMGELLTRHFPASLPQTRHVTINNQAREALYRRTGINAICIRNCFDFDSPRSCDEFNSGLRRDLGISGDEVFFLQPTRAIERKGISNAIKFVNGFAEASGRGSRLVVTGSSEDGFQQKFEELCRNSLAEVRHVPNWFGPWREFSSAKLKYDIRDAYARCDMVTFPSTWEGFGNPVLESVVSRKLLLVAGYPVLDELRSFGFQFLTMDEGAVERAIKLMDYPALMSEMAERNFEIGRRNFSLANLREELAELISAAAFKS